MSKVGLEEKNGKKYIILSMKGSERLVEVLASYAFGTMLDLKKIQYGFLQFLILSFTFEFSIIYLSMSD